MEELLWMWEGEGGALEPMGDSVTGDTGGKFNASAGPVNRDTHPKTEPLDEVEWAEQTRKRLSAEFAHIRNLIAIAAHP